MKENLFFVNSPFQLLCAIEAKEYFNLKNSTLVIFNKGKGRNHQQISYLLDIYPLVFNEVIELDYELKNLNGWINGFNKFQKLIYLYPEVHFIFIGDYRNGLVRHFHNSVSYSRIYILDDGFSTITIYNKLKNYYSYSYKDYIKYIVSFFRYKFRIKKDVIFFTMFAPLFHEGNVVYNKFNNILRDGAKKTTKSIYFLGTPIVEDGIVSNEYYLKKIKQISEHFDSTLITYFPHRREDDNKLKNLELNTGIRVQKISIPIELFLMEAEWPSKVISFYSTALYSISKMFTGIEVYAINIENGEINSRHDEIDSIYEVLKSEVSLI